MTNPLNKYTSTEFPDRDPVDIADLAKDRLGHQLDFLDAIDNKTGVALGLGSGLLGLLAAAAPIIAMPVGSASNGHSIGWVSGVVLG